MPNIDREYKFNRTLLKLSKLNEVDSGHVEESFRLINEAVIEALNIERSSIWFYNDDKTAIISSDLYEKSPRTHSAGMKLEAKDFPNYFMYLLEERTLPANDAVTDPSTSEFADIYLKPLNIVSMLDAPIRVNGHMIGVICCESVGVKREWNIAEQNFIGNITDILARAIQAKERREAMQKLEKMNTHLEELIDIRTKELESQRARTENAAKMAVLGEMASSIAHEINNPLAIIISLVHMIKKNEDNEGGKEKRLIALNNIVETSYRIEKIVKGLRFFARDASLDDFGMSSTRQIIDDTLALCKQKLYQGDIKIIVNLDQDIHFFCQPVSLSQAILNLISNSYDAIHDLDEKWIKLDCTETVHEILISVTDSGKGIRDEIKDKIVLPFFTTKDIGKGTGLGLSITKGIIEQHGGVFKLDTTSPHTRFSISIPKKAAAA